MPSPKQRPDFSEFIADVQRLSESANLDELLVVSLHVGERAGQSHFTFERMVELAFRCFPHRFGLRGYPEWPDSVVVNKCWLRARTDRHWLAGSVREGFRLTAPGREIAERLAASKQRQAPPRSTDSRSREGRLLTALRATRGFERFASGVELTTEDLADGLLATADAPRSTLLNSIAEFRDAAALFSDANVEAFLQIAEERLQGTNVTDGYQGGMMRKRSS